MENNQAFYATIRDIQPIEKKQKIVSAGVMLNGIKVTQVVVGVNDFSNGDLIAYFDSNLALEQGFIEAVDKQHEDYGKEGFASIGRYLARGYRIRSIKLGATASDGLVIKPSLLVSFYENEKEAKKAMVEGNSFSKIGNTEVCYKYISPVQSQSRGSNKSKAKKNSKESISIVAGHFPEHKDTDQFLRNSFKVNPNDLCQISRKVHGCVSHDSIIQTLEYGEKTIKEIVDNKLDCHIKAYNILSKEIVFVPIDQYYLKENDGDWYEIELENGKKLRITGNNPVWLPELNCYRKVEDLKGDEVLLLA